MQICKIETSFSAYSFSFIYAESENDGSEQKQSKLSGDAEKIIGVPFCAKYGRKKEPIVLVAIDTYCVEREGSLSYFIFQTALSRVRAPPARQKPRIHLRF